MKKQKHMKQITAILLIVILLAIIGSTIYFAVSGSQLFWMSLFLMFLFPIFLWAMSFLYKWSKIRTSTDVSFSVLIFILLSDSFQIFFDIFLISIFRWFIKRCSKKLIWKILLFYIMIWIIMRIFISDSMS